MLYLEYNPSFAKVLKERLDRFTKLHNEPSKYSNQLNIAAFEKYLKGKRKEKSDIKWLKVGFPLWLKTHFKATNPNTLSKPNNLSTKISNIANTPQEAVAILDKMIKEAENGQIEPFFGKPEYIIMIFCVPKKDGQGKYTKYRIIRNGSFKTGSTSSINEWIRPRKCKIPSLPNLKQYIKTLIDCNFFAIRDLSDFFRQIGLCEEDSNYICYSLFGLVWRDRKQPYGVSSAPANCQYFAQILIWILDNKIFDHEWRNKSLVHIDDFVLGAVKKADCEEMEKRFDTLMTELNVQVSTKETGFIRTCQQSVLYGILFDLQHKTVGIPPTKYKNFKQLILYTLKYRVISGAALEALCGTIMHWAQLKQPTKALCWNLLQFIHENIRSGNLPKTHNYILPLSILNDLKYWYHFADQIVNVPMSEIILPCNMTMSGSTDASSNQGGFVIGGYWSSYFFTPLHTKNWHINQKEAHVILSALFTFRHYLSGKSIKLYVDNESIFYTIKKKWSSSFNLMLFVYELCHLMLEFKFLIWIEWITSATNTLSDALSRDKIDDFWNTVKDYNLSMSQFKTNTIYYNDFKFIDIIRWNSPNKTVSDVNYDLIEYNNFIDFLRLPLQERARIGYPNYASNFKLD